MNEARIYKLRDDLVMRRRVFGDAVKYIVKDPQRLEYFTIDELSYGLLILCDGRRDLAALCTAAQALYPSMDLDVPTLLNFYETHRSFHFFEDAWERNILLIERRRSSRMKKLKRAFSNPLEIHLPAWDPDRLFGRIAGPLGFLFTTPALVIYAALIATAIWLSSTHASQFMLSFRDLWFIPGKTAIGLVALWAMLLFTVVLHEVGHGLTCKHFGGEVHKIGFLLLYFNPCMFCDVTESYFFEDRRKKHAVTLAGGIVDLLTASLATFVWYFTSPDLFANQVAQRIAIFNGVTGILVNYNPLMKYDGYFLASDSLGMPNLRGDAFQFLGNRVRGLFRLPHEPELISSRERRILWIYAIGALCYSVFVLWFVLRFVGGWLVHSLHGTGYIVTAGLVFLLTRGSLRRLVGFVRFLLLDKAVHLRRHRVPYLAALLAVLAAFFLLPLPRYVRESFTFRPGSEVPVRAAEAGLIETVRADEGEWVAAGTTPVTLRAEMVRLGLEGAHSLRTAAEAGRAAAQVADDPAEAAAQGAQAGMGRALERYYQDCQARVSPRMPFSGVLLTPRLREKLGMACVAGDTLLVLGDLRMLRAEILIDERDLGLLDPARPVQLRTHAAPGGLIRGEVERIAPLPSAARLRPLYRVIVRVENPDQRWRPGQTGIARFDAGRLSLFGQLLASLARIFRIEFWI